MKIAVIGAGAIGSVVAGCLVNSGLDVILIGRPDQVNALQKNNLNIKGIRGDMSVGLKALTRMDQRVDLVIFTVKTQDIEHAFQENERYLDQGIILSTQNGVQADNLLRGHYDREKLLSSIVMFGATYIEPGEVTFNFEGDWILGKPYSPNDQHVTQIADILRKAFNVVISENIMGMKWLKLFVNFNNCLPALIGKSMQETFSDLELCKLSILLLKEGVDITNKAGIKLVSLPQFPVERIMGLVSMPIEQSSRIINKTLTTLSKEPLYGSILQSIMRKKTSEIDFINGEVTHLAKHVNMTAPLNRKVVDLVHRVEREGKFFEREQIKKEFNLN